MKNSDKPLRDFEKWDAFPNMWGDSAGYDKDGDQVWASAVRLHRNLNDLRVLIPYDQPREVSIRLLKKVIKRLRRATEQMRLGPPTDQKPIYFDFDEFLPSDEGKLVSGEG